MLQGVLLHLLYGTVQCPPFVTVGTVILTVWYGGYRGLLCGGGYGSRQWGGRTIHHDIGQVMQQFLSAVLRLRQVEQLRVLINKIRVHHTGKELGMTQDIHQKGGVGLKGISKIL